MHSLSLLLLLFSTWPQLLPAAPALTTPSASISEQAAPAATQKQSPAIAFAALGGDCPAKVRPPDCAEGFGLTLLPPTGCPLYRCEAAAAARLSDDSSEERQSETTDQITGCPEPASLSSATCPGSQVVKTVLERRRPGWCQSRRCACPDPDEAATACMADGRTEPVFAVEKPTGCRLLVECRLRSRLRRTSRCPPPPVCGPDVAPERLIRDSGADCPVYSCPMATAANATSMSSNSTPEAAICPPTVPTCPTGTVSVIVEHGAAAVDYIDDCTAAQRQTVVCEPLLAPLTPTPPPPSTPTPPVAPPCPSEPPTRCQPGELALPLVSARWPRWCPPRLACLAVRAPPWLPVCPGAANLCRGVVGGGGLRTELSVTEFGILCVQLVCQPSWEAAVDSLYFWGRSDDEVN
ncbi:hypothetical protein BOX15_Mlig007045g1 [Macrostomum lignano]|uniref:Uncharacterized protein n=1 Tax=Macrostomum lignano TaxID=282301 RepID=A0A267F5R0_9PLAT|nr:hypothetical protein BOX15_Mlig007045g1 [Macrostomum lignano]